MRFRRPVDLGFWRALAAEAEAITRSRGGPFATGGLWAKAALYAAFVAASYGWLLAGPSSFAATLAAYGVFNLAALLLVLNVAHDAAHDSLTRHPRLNRVVGEGAFGLLGIDGHLWRLRHTRSHHLFPNVNGCDADIDHNPFLRLSPNHPWRRRHRWQHLYALPVYLLVHLHAIFVQDAIYICQKSLANLRDIRHSPARHAGFVAAKLLYFAALLGLPIACSTLAWTSVIAAYVLATAVTSLVFVLMLIGTHFADGNVFPVPDAEGYIGSSYVEHVFASSLDWAPTSRVATFLIGGLNAHVAHHLFPRISHAHYRAISRAIDRLARRHGVEYHRTGLAGMISAHFRHLRQMGRRDGAAGTS
ncbi:fatty acid desaturase family protein [Reyranella sp.]|uniref:fatty acid desaturase family protein n=1 Tax=Reyranella sp. TaxID=1929291 RepID=UPI003BA8C49D